MTNSLKVTVDSKAIKEAVKVCNRFTTGRSLNPILSYVNIKVTDGQIEASATDLEVGIRVREYSGYENEGAFEVCLPGKKLLQVLKGAKGPLTLMLNEATDKEGLRVDIDNAYFQGSLLALSSKEFPVISLPKDKKVQSFTLPAKMFMSALCKVTHAISSDTTRPVLTGLLLESRNGQLMLIATDGHRLATTWFPFQSEPFQVILPRKTVADLIALLSGSQGNEVRMITGRNQIAFELDGMFLLSRLIDGQFPNWRQVIPACGKQSEPFEVDLDKLTKERAPFEVDLKMLKEAVGKVSIATSDRYNLLKLSLDKGLLRLSAETPDSGAMKVEIPVSYEGSASAIEWGCNPDFLMDILKNIDAQRVVIFVKDPLSGVVLIPAGEQRAYFILMPMPIKP